ncbi:hypothetical protein KW790_00170 [Candidatus Parcubacteria bacterium]|nr:hypothetical protein [Candidatus Parcubacteria bacterium]
MTIVGLLAKIDRAILNPLILLLFAIAFIIFFIGIVKFISNAGDAEGRKQGKRSILFGLIGMLIMFSAYGIIRFILNTLNSTIGTSQAPANIRSNL